MPKSYYEILDVDPKASEEEIRRAYRKKIRQFHPDLNPEKAKAHRKSREINIAFEVLTDPEKRRRYDKKLKRMGKAQANAEFDFSKSVPEFEFEGDNERKANREAEKRKDSTAKTAGGQRRQAPAHEPQASPTTESSGHLVSFWIPLSVVMVSVVSIFLLGMWAFYKGDPTGFLTPTPKTQLMHSPAVGTGSQRSDSPDSGGTKSELAKIEIRLNSIIQKQESRIAQLERSKNRSIESESIPVGSIVPYAGNTVPVGWLECDGSSFDSNKLPVLRNLLGSNKLPDLRGEFVRGWDHGKGIDTGRELLSSQEQELLKHKHSIATANGNDQGYPGNNQHNAIRTTDRHQRNEAGNENHLVLPIGGAENRPRNVALMFVIKTD